MVDNVTEQVELSGWVGSPDVDIQERIGFARHMSKNGRSEADKKKYQQILKLLVDEKFVLDEKKKRGVVDEPPTEQAAETSAAALSAPNVETVLEVVPMSQASELKLFKLEETEDKEAVVSTPEPAVIEIVPEEVKAPKIEQPETATVTAEAEPTVAAAPKPRAKKRVKKSTKTQAPVISPTPVEVEPTVKTEGPTLMPEATITLAPPVAVVEATKTEARAPEPVPAVEVAATPSPTPTVEPAAVQAEQAQAPKAPKAPEEKSEAKDENVEAMKHHLHALGVASAAHIGQQLVHSKDWLSAKISKQVSSLMAKKDAPSTETPTTEKKEGEPSKIKSLVGGLGGLFRKDKKP